MKKITSVLCALMVLMSVNAAPAVATRELGKPGKIELQAAPRLMQFVAAQPSNRAPQADGEFVSGTYYTAEGSAYYAGNEDATGYIPSIEVVVEGDNVAITGLSIYIPTGTINGKKEGNVITFASGQSLGTVQSQGYSVELFLLGTADGKTPSDITFEWDSEAGTLTAGTMLAECTSATSLQPQPIAFWQKAIFTATKPEKPDTVTVPENLELKEYAMTYTDYQKNPGSGSAFIGIDGNDVYMVGFSTYLPEAAVKGTKEGNTVTFAPNQYLGAYGPYDVYFVTGAVFEYNADQDTYTASSEVYSLAGGKYIDRYTSGLVLKGVVEKAVMPANPSIKGLKKDQSYGYVVQFDVPCVDVNGEGLVASKLYYELFTDIDGTVAPLTFTPATHTYLEEELTIIPFGFTENYDFYGSAIYLNDLYSADWDKLGIKSIYYGCDEATATEIQWYTIDKGQAVDNINAAAKATKVIVNGQLIIRQGEKTYNANGVEVK